MSSDTFTGRQNRPREHKKSRAEILRDRTRGSCGYCGCELESGQATRDHIVPRASGGATRTDNLMLCCFPCNQAKAHMSIEAFRARKFGGSMFWFELIKEGLV